MARVTPEQAERMSSSGEKTPWFKLENDGDTCIIQFPYKTVEDIARLSVHEVPIPGTEWTSSVDCLRDLESPISDCPMCECGFTQKSKIVLEVYNHTTGRVEFWQRSNTFVKKNIESLISLYGTQGDFDFQLFQIQRIGAKGYLKTEYSILLAPQTSADVVDWNELDDQDMWPPVVGKEFTSPVRERTAADMEYYLENDAWPGEESRGNAQTAQRPGRVPPRPQASKPAPAQDTGIRRRQAPAAPAAASRQNRATAAPRQQPAAQETAAPASRAATGGSRSNRRTGDKEVF